MAKYQFTLQAQQDLIQIRRFTVKQWGSKQSTVYLHELKKKLDLLSEMPLMGTNCTDSLGKNIYRFLYGSHVIYYFSMPRLITVIAILHQSMVPKIQLENRINFIMEYK